VKTQETSSEDGIIPISQSSSSKSVLSVKVTTPKKAKSGKAKKENEKSSSPSATVGGTPSKERRKSTLSNSNDSEVKENELTPTNIVASPSSTKQSTRPSRKLGSAVALDLSFDEAQSSPTRRIKESKTVVQPNVKKVYKLIHHRTGSIGGNGTTGAIYGELTIGSMQKVIDILVEKCELTHSSRFIDVGAGLGKPNLHAAQDPAVRVSIGVELETIRWQVGYLSR
jgi:hypothetical protein